MHPENNQIQLTANDEYNFVGSAEYFSNPEGIFACGSKWEDGPFLFSRDGRIFYELKITGFEGNSEEHYLSFENPHHNNSGKLHRVKDELELNGKKYQKYHGVKNDDRTEITEIEVVLLPRPRQLEYVFKLPDGQFLCVSANKSNDPEDCNPFYYNSFRLFIGPQDAMRQIPVEEVDRLRDGMTFVDTAEGTLSYYHGNKEAIWQGDIELMWFDPKRFAIVENNSYATLQAV